MKNLRLPKEYLLDSAILTLWAVVIFGRIVGHHFLSNWDDNWYVLYNDAVRGFSWAHLRDAFTNYYVGFYAPLHIVSYMADYSLWGLWPGGYLCTNIILHAANGLLIYYLLRRWYGDRLLAFVSAAIFLVHPVQVESVAWISERKTLLGMFFFLIAWERYCRYRDLSQGAGRGAYVASLAAFVLSLLAKSTGVVLPVVLVLYDRCFAGENRRRPTYLDKIPFVLGAGLFSVLVMFTQLPGVSGGGRTAYHGGSPLATFYTMLPVFCRYLRMLVWPAGLSATYAPPIRHGIDGAVALSALLLAGVAILTVRLYRTDRRLAFWALFFWVGLLPVSQIVPVISLMYDHYLYLPLMGAAVLAGSGGVWLRDRLKERRYLLYPLLLLPLIALSVASFVRAAVWKDTLTLFSDAVQKEPESDKAWDVLGGVYQAEGKVDLARAAYERGLGLNPANAEILDGLGALYTETGELDKGYLLLRRLVTMRPDYVTGWASLGTNYLKRGNYVEAEKAYKRAQHQQPDALQVVMLLGDLYRKWGRLDLARGYYLQAEAKGWTPVDTAYRLACVESAAGHPSEALGWLEKSLQRGFDDYDRLYEDRELASLRSDPRFARLVGRYFAQ